MTREEYGAAYEKGFPLTLRFLLSRAAPKEIAEEITQIAWTKGWMRLEQLRDPSAIVLWVNSIAFNIYRAQLRPKVFIGSHGGRLGWLDPDKTTELDLACIDVRKILSSLGESDRLLLEQYLAGYTAVDLAPQYGTSELAMRLRLLRARRNARAEAESRIS